MSDGILSQDEINALMQAGGAGGSTPASSEDSAQAEPEAAEQPTISVTPPSTPAAPKQPEPAVRRPDFSPLNYSADANSRNGMELILDVQLQVAVELGRTKMLVRDVLALGPGAVVELDKHAGEPVEISVNNKIVARGEVVVIDENFGVRITEIVSASERDVQAKAA